MNRSMERSRENSRNRDTEPSEILTGEICFTIRKHLGGRQGWKIMPEKENTLKQTDALMKVVSLIKDMELKGHAIPEKITIKE